ncbi:hypothetical protein KEM55_005513, partial [Ascosphaera atra]
MEEKEIGYQDPGVQPGSGKVNKQEPNEGAIGVPAGPSTSHQSHISEEHRQSESDSDDSITRKIKEEGIEVHDWYGPDDPENP